MSNSRKRGPSKPRQIAPRLASGEKRESGGHRLPPNVKSAFRLIAEREGKSMSWVLENVVIDYFGLRRPEYVKPKQKS